MTKDNLESLRNKIDGIDESLQDLLNKRALCAKKIAEFKMHNLDPEGENSNIFYRPEREAQVLRKVMDRNKGPLESAEVAHLFREIMSSCLALEQPMEVAFLGPAGTFTQAAALKHFGHAAITKSMVNISEVFEAVEKNICHFGVVPVENSTEGMVTHTLDHLISSPLKICGELELPIELHLLAGIGCNSKKIDKIYGHQQAIAQSRQWLQKNYSNVELVAVSSNGEAAKMAAKNPNFAAIAGDLAAEYYELVCLASGIQDYSDNTTRFLVISKDEVPASGDDKTALLVSTRNVPGALFRLLQPLENEGISLTRIESRPSRTENWAYIFFIEFHGHHQDESIKRVLESISEKSSYVKVLGSFPVAVI